MTSAKNGLLKTGAFSLLDEIHFFRLRLTGTDWWKNR
jgi:hypothetical protein